MTLSLPFPAQDLEYAADYVRLRRGARSSGLFNVGDFTVSPGSGTQVQVSAGEANVPQTVSRSGSFYTSRGQYYVFNDAVSSPANSLASPTVNPRVDQIIARVYDVREQLLSGSSFWQFEWLSGSETSGANLTNLSGAAATLPANSLRLAYVLRTVGESSIPGGNIRGVRTQASLGAMPLSTNSTSAATFAVLPWQSLYANPASGGCVATLPASPSDGDELVIIAGGSVSGTNQVLVTANTGQFIYGIGAALAASIPLGTPFSSVKLRWDGGAWFVISNEQDTGWVPITLGPGVSTPSTAFASGGFVAAARLRGDMVELSGSLHGPSSTTNWGTVPSGMNPSKPVFLSANIGGGNAQITTGGVISSFTGVSDSILDGVSYRVS